MKTSRLGALAGIVLLAACASAPEAMPPLPGTQWKLADVDSGPLATLAADSGVTLAFEAERLAGYGGCNQYSGSYSIDGETLEVGPVIATKRGCIGTANDAEAAWFAVLAQPVGVAYADEALILRGSDGSVLRFVRAAK
jgi:heat shock protein HslJ